ncbi:MAG: hypothetical protein M0Z50_16045 [Planctomycetia bacterium]|nr:hypothetical protein [Planctomycetia bacterium]
MDTEYLMDAMVGKGYREIPFRFSDLSEVLKNQNQMTTLPEKAVTAIQDLVKWGIEHEVDGDTFIRVTAKPGVDIAAFFMEVRHMMEAIGNHQYTEFVDDPSMQ